MTITHEVLDLTPELAHELLRQVPHHQRKLTKNHVTRLAEAMLNGRFMFTPQPLIVDSNGALVDGQHRCQAVVESGITVPVVLTRGADPEVFALIDTGKARLPQQFIRDSNAAMMAAAARFVLGYRESGPGVSPTSLMRSLSMILTNKQILDEVEQDAEYAAAAPQVLSIRRAAKITPGPLLAVHILAGRNVDPDKCSLWLSGLETGEELAKGDPRLALRNRFIQTPVHGQPQQFMLIVKAWNAWLTDAPVKQLRYRANELLPVVIGANEHLLTPADQVGAA
jgi:hypothetical protein